MNTLIIGGSGHLSGTLALVALGKGHTVWIVTRGNKPVPEGVTPLIADRKDHTALSAVIAGQDQVWDLVVDCICFDEADMRHDIELFRSRARHFVFVSTDLVYHPSRRRFPQPAETGDYVRPEDALPAYGLKKRECEIALQNADTGGMAWTIVRPCHIYGPRSELGCLPMHQRDPRIIHRIRAREAIRLVGGGRFLQQPIRADDLCETILSASGNRKAAGGIFNTAGPDIIESWHYYRIIADTLGVPLEIEDLPVASALAEHPELAPSLCHRIYDLSPLAAAGLHVPATPIEIGLRLHINGLLERQS
ncbi:MAG: NAD-dependent epimerase/dehydratase family protein [Opitutaceae bacterium]